MNRARILLFGSFVAVAMIFGGVIGATAAHSTLTQASAATPTPTPGFKSNETSAHEAGESAARETAENNGTFRPGGPGGPGNGMSNETPAHEAGEPASREASEKS